MKIKQPADLENALKQPLTPAFAVSLLKRFLKELPEQVIPPDQSSAIFKITNDPGRQAIIDSRSLTNSPPLLQVPIRIGLLNYEISS